MSSGSSCAGCWDCMTTHGGGPKGACKFDGGVGPACDVEFQGRAVAGRGPRVWAVNLGRPDTEAWIGLPAEGGPCPAEMVGLACGCPRDDTAGAAWRSRHLVFNVCHLDGGFGAGTGLRGEGPGHGCTRGLGLSMRGAAGRGSMSGRARCIGSWRGEELMCCGGSIRRGGSGPGPGVNRPA